jgi:DNA-binding NtrC family response regulator
MPADLKILIVDDERLVRRSLQKTLIRAGFDVDSAGNCSEGLMIFQDAVTASTPFDLVLLDLNMPNFDGVQQDGAGLTLLSRLLELSPGLPAIILTAYDDIDKTKDAMTRGAKAYFVKGREKGLVNLINEIV